MDEYAKFEGEYIHTYCFNGESYFDCLRKFEVAPIFDGFTIYQAEHEIEVVFG